MSDPGPDRDRSAEDEAGRDAAGSAPDSDPGGSTVTPQLDERLRSERAPIEPEEPNPENALFVILGALGTVGLLASAFAPSLV